MIVIASLRTEASPIVLREAFASGRPVIATKVGDIPEIIEHRQNGLLIEPGDSKALAAAILEFVRDPNLAVHCATNGLRYARKHFSFDEMMKAKLQADIKLIPRNAGIEPGSGGCMEGRAPASPAAPVSAASQELRPPL
jgi:glycosyltransferase involved in cell wall biosynthesis